MRNLYSMTTNVKAIRRLFGVDAEDDRVGNLSAMPGIFPDYPAPIVRNGPTGRELAMARWGMASSQRATDGTRSARSVQNQSDATLNAQLTARRARLGSDG